MDADATERERVLDARIAELEARLQLVERRLGLPPEPVAAILPAAPPIAAPPPSTQTYWSAQAPAPRPTPPSLPGPVEWAPTESTFRLLPTIRRGITNLAASLPDLEARLTGRALAWAGGLALVLGAIFFLSLAFSRGWIGPELRVVIGLGAGVACLVGGGALIERGNRLLGHVLTPVGLAVISISLVGATRLYDLIPVEIGLGIALVSAVATAVIAVRADSPVVAGFGLVSVLAAPPLMDAAADIRTLAFVAVVLVGTTGVALWRTWAWLPAIAFVLSAPQAAAWILGKPDPWVGMAGLGLFWMLNVTSAGGEEFRRRRNDLSASSASLLVGNAAFLVWAGFALLSDDLMLYRGPFLVIVAIAHLVMGWYFVARDGERNLFGLLAIGTGIAALTMAAPVQLGAPAVPLAWTAEAVALAWVAVRRGHPYSAIVSALLFVLAAGNLVSIYITAQPSQGGVAFLDGAGAALAFFLVGIGAGVWIARDASARSTLCALGLVTAAWCASERLDAPGTVIALTILVVVGVAARRVLPALPSEPIPWQIDGLIPRSMRGLAHSWPSIEQVLPGALVLVGAATTLELVIDVFGSPFALGPAGFPFSDPAGAALVAYLVGVGCIAIFSGEVRLRHPLTALGLLVVIWACPSELDGLELVAAWAGLMVVGFAIWYGLDAFLPRAPIRLSGGRDIRWPLGLEIPLVSLAAGSLAAAHLMWIELPAARFGEVLPPTIPFTDTGAAAAAILVLAILLVGALARPGRERRLSIIAAAVVTFYAIPYEVYAWAVVVLWAGIGAGALQLVRFDRDGRTIYLAAAVVAVVGAAGTAVGIVAPPTRLVVTGAGVEPLVALQTAIALGVLVVAAAMLGRFERTAPRGRWAWVAAGVTVVYLLSVAAVDVVAGQVGRGLGLEELKTQGQVALSVTWAAAGVIGFVAGLRLRIGELRQGGLGLLALATGKVFLFDLSALEVAYRVISLIALGLLLLASAWIWQRLQPRPRADDPPV